MRFLGPVLRVLIGDGAMVGHLAVRIKMGLPSFRGARQREPGISRGNLWIPGLRFAHPGMTELQALSSASAISGARKPSSDIRQR